MSAERLELPARAGLKAHEAAAFCGLSRSWWDDAWKAGAVPEPRRLTARVVLWSADELRAWMAHGCPPAEDWRRIWLRMLERGSWCGAAAQAPAAAAAHQQEGAGAA